MKIMVVGAGRTGSRGIGLLAPKLSEKDELLVVDRDALEESNLDGCVMYSKRDLGELKAELLAKKISDKTKASTVAFALHLSPENISELSRGAGMVLDCTDNWQTRILLNEYCWKKGIPWIYAGAIKSRGMCSTIVPRYTPCFACWAGKPEKVQSCSEQGVDRQALRKIAKIQAAEALLLLRGGNPELAGRLLFCDASKGFERTITLEKKPSCVFCVKGKRLYREGGAATMCGGKEWLFESEAVTENERLSVKEIYSKLEGMERRVFGSVVKVRLRGSEATVFPSGRAMVRAKTRGHAADLNQVIMQKLA